MASTVTDVTGLANQALARLGASRITAITGSTEPAPTLNEAWPAVRDEVLRDWDWAIATKRAALAELSTTNLTGYDYAYQLPNDFLNLQSLIDMSDTYYTELPNVEFSVEGRVLYCDQESLGIKYTYRLTDVSQYDPDLVRVMSTRLAAEVAPVVVKNETVRQQLLAEYVAFAEKAKEQETAGKSESAQMTKVWGSSLSVADAGRLGVQSQTISVRLVDE